MDRELRLELILYSIRCKKCKKHKPLYLHPQNYNTPKELRELYCKRCLGKVEVEVNTDEIQDQRYPMKEEIDGWIIELFTTKDDVDNEYIRNLTDKITKLVKQNANKIKKSGQTDCKLCGSIWYLGQCENCNGTYCSTCINDHVEN